MSPDNISQPQQPSVNNDIPGSPQVFPQAVAPTNTFAQPDPVPSAPVQPQMITQPMPIMQPLPVDTTPVNNSLGRDTMSDQPVPIVKTYSVKGVEYGMMTFSLLLGAVALIFIFISLINGGTSLSLLSFPLALLITTLPLFAFFFIRLKRAEIANPALRFDASKRRFSQLTQFLTFATCLFNIVSFIYIILSNFASNGSYSILKGIGDLLIILVIAGGILAYYWNNEHRLIKH